MKNFYFVYVLFSEKDRKLYIGFTSDLEQRKRQHFNGEVISTFRRRPLKLIYFEAHLSKIAALRREAYFKTTSGKRTLRQMLKETLEELQYEGLS